MFERTIVWLKGWERLALAAAVGFQLFVLVGMIVLKLWPLWTGETLLLRVVPVDPRDMFRGDYVTLSYDFSRTRPDLATPRDGGWRRDCEGQAVYVSLVPEEDGKHWRTGGIDSEPPKTGKYIRGTFDNGGRIGCGIESYYVQEGQGRVYENAIRFQRLSAEISLTSGGRATLRRLYVEPPEGKKTKKANTP